MKKEDENKTIARNKKAYHDYFIDETFEAGVELTGCEVKSLRENHCQLTDCFVLIRKGEAWLHNVHIASYSHGNIANCDPDRKRRLLLHKNEIRYLAGKTLERGFTLVPLAIYFNRDGRVKLAIGLARGKKNYDKRATLAERDSQRDIDRALKARQR